MDTKQQLNCQPIGYFDCEMTEKYMVGRQPNLSMDKQGIIVLNPGCNFEQALEDLIGFSHIWVIYWFNRNELWKPTWKPKVLTPRGGEKRGVFATRSPHRKNPIGISCVELKSIQGRTLIIGKNDLLDKTPILDIKPYLTYCDCHPNATSGWTNGVIPTDDYQIQWDELAFSQMKFICNYNKLFKETLELRLKENPLPFPGHRIKEIAPSRYEIALKTWRIQYSLSSHQILIHSIKSGYDKESLAGSKISVWQEGDDSVKVHALFNELFLNP